MGFLQNILARFKEPFGLIKTRLVSTFRNIFGGSLEMNLQRGTAIDALNKKQDDALKAVNEKVSNIKDELFNFKRPKSLNEYYHFGKWLISKRVGNLIFIAAVLLSILYIVLVFIPNLKLKKLSEKFGVKTDVKEYFYNSPKLKKYTGIVRVFSRENKAVFEGNLTNGLASGIGSLYDKDGAILYNGEFLNNRYSGKGTLYYKNGLPKYTGGFFENLYNGEGTLYSENGQLLYIGYFLKGEKSGKGKLYNEFASPIYEGTFIEDVPNLSSYIGVSINEVNKAFLGEKILYTSGNEVMINYPDVNCILVADRKSDSTEELDTIKKIFVIPPSYYPGTSEKGNRLDLDNILSKNFLEGFTNTSIEELAVIDAIKQNGSNKLKKYQPIKKELVLDKIYSLKEEDNYSDKIYISKHKNGNYIYTFYFEELENPYVFYSIERLS